MFRSVQSPRRSGGAFRDHPPGSRMTELDPALTEEAREALAHYGREHASLESLGGGLINLTCLVTAEDGSRTVLQRLHPVFDPAVNLNLEAVTAVLAASGLTTPRLLHTRDGAAWVTVEGRHWRLLTHVAATSVDALEDTDRAREAGRLLASFHAALADWTTALPHRRPPVHEPARHFAALRAAREAHTGHPLAAAVAGIAAEISTLFATLPALPGTPLRLVHGDPKISNLLFDEAGRGCCLVDLDTLAHAPLCFELGDAFRSWCNPGPEDAAAPAFDAALFEAALAGYATLGRAFMTPDERASVVPATAAVCLELAARFAADALEERYFGWAPARWATRGEHNLARAGNQLGVARDLLRQRAALERDAARILG
jgi:Ser/Thr protein kinase RdoA (MazF antagonist)